MAFITNENGEFYVPDEIANDPTKTVLEIQQAAIPKYVYLNMVMDEKVGGKLGVLSLSVRSAFEELCLIAGEDSTGRVSTKFFNTYEDIYKPLYDNWLIPQDLYMLNKENLELAYN